MARPLHPSPPGATRQPRRQRFNAWTLRVMDAYLHRKLGKHKTHLFSQLPQTVVELGAGTGANFRYMRQGTRVIGVEPNPHMHPALQRAAHLNGIDLTIHPERAEALSLPNDSAEAVVASLVLCSVSDPEAVVVEAFRILRPGGRFICIEHVAAPAGSLLARLQRWLLRPWRWLFDGCHLDRDTAGILHRAGFHSVRVTPFTMKTMVLPIRPQIVAVAYK